MQGDLIGAVQADARQRSEEVACELRSAFADFVSSQEMEVIVFSDVTVDVLARGFRDHPTVLKPLLVICNVAARAIERDIDIKNLNTYSPKLSNDQAYAVAGYLKPFLPPHVTVEALCELDRTEFIDKEIRARKGRWEKLVLAALCAVSDRAFGKTMFDVAGEKFEMDAALRGDDGEIAIGVDVKRCEARRDIHKRCDEIVNKAQKLKQAYPSGRFGVVFYYPFIEEHGNVRERLRSPNIDSIVFASEAEESIRNAASLLLGKLMEV